MCMSNLWKDWRNQLTQALQYPNFRNRGYAMADSICHVQIYKHINGSKKLLPTFLSSKDDETAPLRPQLVTAAEIPKMFRALVFVSGPPTEVPRFTKLLQGQNAGLPEDLWHLRYQQATDQGKIIVWSTDKDSADALKAIGDRPHFGLVCGLRPHQPDVMADAVAACADVFALTETHLQPQETLPTVANCIS